jgi:transporter family protein
MHWSVYALLSAVFAALVAVFGKIGLKDVDSTLATTVRAAVMALFLICVSLSLGKLPLLSSLHAPAMLYIVLSGVAGALSWLFYFFAIKSGTVSGVVAIDRTSVIFALALAALFLGEQITWQKVFGTMLVAGGALLVAL